MQNVTVKKDWLLGVVQKNRANHKAEYEKAFAGYREECIACLEENLNAMRDNKITRVRITEVPPEDHTKDYDRVIAMLGASVADEVELSAHEFDNYVQDDWGWKELWATSNSKYLCH